VKTGTGNGDRKGADHHASAATFMAWTSKRKEKDRRSDAGMLILFSFFCIL
jgi:hypothetical protein